MDFKIQFLNRDFLINTAHKTDNKGNLFVTVFELTAFYIMTHISLHPDSAPVLALKLCVS